jgi:LDH2 family malate/lactate/ureidoglycolate dehydrogenase
MPQIAADHLDVFLRRIYEAAGVPSDAAATVSRHQVAANLVGHDSHGAMRTPDYVALIERGDVDPTAQPEVVEGGPSSAVIDAHWGLGFVGTEFGLDEACRRAGQTGLAAVTIRRQGHIGRLGAYTASAADRGFIAMMTADSGRAPKSVAPFGGREARLGTNPISFAVPTARHGALVLDMATSTVAGGKVKVAASRGQTLPDGWIVSKDGEPSNDPQEYLDGGALLPLGADQGHKGYGLSVMVEILSGLLTGIGFGVYPDGIHNDGVFLTVFDVARFRPPEAFLEETSEFIEYLRATPPAVGVEQVLTPGELEQRTREQRETEGIPIEDRTVERLDQLAAHLDVTPLTA